MLAVEPAGEEDAQQRGGPQVDSVVGVEGHGVEVLVAVALRVSGVVYEDGGRSKPFGRRVEQRPGGFGDGEIEFHTLGPDARLAQPFEQGLGVAFANPPMGEEDVRAVRRQRKADGGSYAPGPAGARYHGHAPAWAAPPGGGVQPRTQVSFITPPLEMLTRRLPGAATRVIAPGTTSTVSGSGERAWTR